MLCANGHKVLLEILMKTISEKNPKDKSKLINQQNCDGNTALRNFLIKLFRKLDICNRLGCCQWENRNRSDFIRKSMRLLDKKRVWKNPFG